MAGLSDFQVKAVLRAEDYDRARTFYREVLGLSLHPTAEGLTREGSFEAGSGTSLTIYERPGMPAPQNTALAFNVPAARFYEVMAELRGKGVVFEEYDIPEIGLKTVNGVAEIQGTKGAWFRDTEGNIIALEALEA